MIPRSYYDTPPDPVLGQESELERKFRTWCAENGVLPSVIIINLSRVMERRGAFNDTVRYFHEACAENQETE